MGDAGETHVEMTIPGTPGWAPGGPASTLREHRPERGAASRKEHGFLEGVALTPVPKGHWALGQQGFVGVVPALGPMGTDATGPINYGAPRGLPLGPLSPQPPPSARGGAFLTVSQDP